MKSLKYLIVANGPFLPKSIIVEAAQDACILALDGAANHLMRLGIKPDIVLGDFDSIQQNSDIAQSGVLLIPAHDQNLTDFQKGLAYALREATLIHVICATGGRMDHEQATLWALQRAASLKKCPIYLHNESQTMTFASNESIVIHGKHHDHCGLFGMPMAAMSVKNGGLEYGSKDFYALTPWQFSAANRLIGNEGAIVEIQGDALIVNPPMLESQRRYAAKSRKEQLQELLCDLQNNIDISIK